MSTGRDLLRPRDARTNLQPCGDLKTSRPCGSKNRRRATRRFTQKKMNVIRHHNISNQKKTVTTPHFSKYSCKHTSGPSRAKQRQPPITRARHKMQIVFAIISFQVFGHESENTKPHPLRTAKDGPPRFVLLLHGEYNQCYHQHMRIGNQKKICEG